MLLRKNIDLYNTIKALAGVNDFTTEEDQNLTDLTNRRLTMAYNTSPMWERYVVVGEKRTVSDFVLDGTTSLYDGPFYKYGKKEVTTGNFADFFVPTNQDIGTKRSLCIMKINAGAWRVLQVTYTRDPKTNIVTTSLGSNILSTQVDVDADGNYIDYASPTEVIEWDNAQVPATRFETKHIIQFNETYEINSSEALNSREEKTEIQDFIRIHGNQSFLNRSATEYDFYVDSFGANVLNGNFTNNEAYVTYKKPILDDFGKVINSLNNTI